MFSRRPIETHNRGRVAQQQIVSSSAPTTPLTIFGGPSVVLCWVRGDLGVTLGTGAASWADQSGNVRDFAQASGAAQPTVTASDATLNNLQTLTGDGTDDIMAATIDRPAPGVGTETTILAVLKQISNTSGDAIYGAGNSILALVQSASPTLVMRNTTSVNSSSGAPIGTWVRSMQQFTGSTSDLNKLGSAAAVTGASAGVTDPGATFSIFARTSAGFANVALFELVMLTGVPSAGQVSAYDAYVTALTAGGVVV